MEKKQTAVEWLIEKINSDQYQTAFGQTYIMIGLIELAKEFEREQIIDSFNFGTINWDKDITAEQFYNQTYGKETNTSSDNI